MRNINDLDTAREYLPHFNNEIHSEELFFNGNYDLKMELNNNMEIIKSLYS